MITPFPVLVCTVQSIFPFRTKLSGFSLFFLSIISPHPFVSSSINVFFFFFLQNKVIYSFSCETVKMSECLAVELLVEIFNPIFSVSL